MAEGDGQSPELATGCQVVLRTTLGEEVKATVFAYDRQTNCLLLKEAGSHAGVCNLRFLKANYVKEVISAEPPGPSFDPRLPQVDVDRCKKREEKALKQAELDASKIGENVTNEAQSIFDSLSKTMPCRWKGKTIIVLDEVFIEFPYDTHSCTASDEHKSALDRVRKVLQAERARLGLSN